MNGAIHFLHVVSALGLTAAFGEEAAGLIGLRRAASADEALLWLRSRRWVLLIGPASIGLVLATGIYMTVAEWGADAWILVSLVSLVGLASIGGVLTGVPMARITPAVEQVSGPLPRELRRDLRSPLLMVSFMTRIAITIGIVFLMVQKPALLTLSSRSSWPPRSAPPWVLSRVGARRRPPRSAAPRLSDRPETRDRPGPGERIPTILHEIDEHVTYLRQQLRMRGTVVLINQLTWDDRPSVRATLCLTR